MNDIERMDIGRGFYADQYFNNTKEILVQKNKHPIIRVQYFCRKDNTVLSGMQEIRDLINELILYKYINKENFKLYMLNDGDVVNAWETVLLFEGDAQEFVTLETIILGILSMSGIATETRKCVQAANGKPVIFFGARFDHYKIQEQIGYAALVGGASGVSTDANGYIKNIKGTGTIPHILIGCFGGNTVEAAMAFDDVMPESVKRTVLVDFDNDSVNTTIDVVNAFAERAGYGLKGDTIQVTGKDNYIYDPDKFIGEGKGKIWSVRFDTSNLLRDKSVTPIGEQSLGVCPELVFKAKDEFNSRGWGRLKIGVSGGFNHEKIALFEKLNTCVDWYGVGDSIAKQRISFTADICEIFKEGKWVHCSKVGRSSRPNSKLQEIKL